MPQRLFAGFRDHPEAVLAGGSGLIVALLALLLYSNAPTDSVGEARFLVNLFKFFVGLYCMAISMFLYYGPDLYEHGICTRLTPTCRVPIEVVVLYFVLGAGVVLTSLAIVRPGLGLVLFWSVVGYSTFFAVATAYFVLLLERTRLRHTKSH